MIFFLHVFYEKLGLSVTCSITLSLSVNLFFSIDSVLFSSQYRPPA